MTNVIKQNGGGIPGLPADFAKQLSSGIAESRATTVIAGGGKPLLRMGKDGVWIFGPSNDEVQDGSLWQVNIITLAHGWCCWVDGGKDKNVLAGEVMASMTHPKPPQPAPIGDTPYAEQRSFELKCINGEDDGLEVLYKTASVGGMRAVDGLLADIQVELTAYHQNPVGPAYVCPVLALENDSYNHPKWGKTYNPILTVVGWADLEGNERPDGEQVPPWVVEQASEGRVREQEPAPEPAPAKPQRVRAAATAPKAVEPAPAPAPTRVRKPAPRAAAAVAEPVSTTQAHVGQRRRPVAR